MTGNEDLIGFVYGTALGEIVEVTGMAVTPGYVNVKITYPHMGTVDSMRRAEQVRKRMLSDAGKAITPVNQMPCS